MSKKGKPIFDEEAPDIDLGDNEDTLAPETGIGAAPVRDDDKTEPAFQNSFVNSPSLSLEKPVMPAPPKAKSYTSSGGANRNTDRELNKAIGVTAKKSIWPYIITAALLVGIGYGIYQAFIVVEKSVSDSRGEFLVNLREKPAAKKSEPVGSDPAAVALPALGILEFETDEVGYEVFIDKRPVTVLENRVELNAGAKSVMVRKQGFEDIYLNAEIVADTTNKLPLKFVRQSKKGFLTFETVPRAHLTLYSGNKIIFEQETPVHGASIPVGTYRAVLTNPLIGHRSEETIQIQEWKTTNLRRQLGN